MNHRRPAPSRCLLTGNAPSHRLPPRSICRRPAKACFECQPRSMRHKPPLPASCPNAWRDARAGRNRAHPSLARALPRRQSGLARLRSPVCLRSYRAGLRAPRAHHWPPPLLTQLPQRASRVAALRASARFSPPVPPRAFCGQWYFCSLPRKHRAPRRCRRVPPRFARTAPRPSPANAFALLSPPRACPLHFPSLRAWRRADSAAIVPLHHHHPHRPPHASGDQWLAMLAARIEQGRSPALPRNSLPRG